MTIYSDLDSVINNFSESALNTLNNLYDTNYTQADITYWDFFKSINPCWYMIMNDKQFWRQVKINPYAVSVLEQAVKLGHQVYIATASSFTDSLGFKIRNTLKAFNPDLINEHNVIIAHDKHLLQGDFLIDDRGSNLTGFKGHGILLNKPWNQYYKPNPYRQFSRVNNWDEIADIILKKGELK